MCVDMSICVYVCVSVGENDPTSSNKNSLRVKLGYSVPISYSNVYFALLRKNRDECYWSVLVVWHFNGKVKSYSRHVKNPLFLSTKIF